MRLIDADKLKYTFKNMISQKFAGYCDFEKLIDNAPTATLSFLLDNVSDEDVEKFKDIWQRATSKGLLLQPERPQGEWNYIQAGMCVCPFCGAYPHKKYKNFCPNCGADMRGKADQLGGAS